jgi:mevalonate kinase
LQYNHKKKELFEKLGQIATEIDHVLSLNDENRLGQLLTQHNDVMVALNHSNEVVDIGMKDIILETEEKVRSVLSRINSMQTEIKKQMAVINNKRMLKTAYHSMQER